MSESLKFLIVDDELVSREKMRALLSDHGRCVVADGGREGLLRFWEAYQIGAPFRLVTLDMEMPDMDGRRVLTEIRSFEDSQSIPPDQRAKVVMVTAHSERDKIFACLQEGCDDYVVKPFDPTAIRHRLQKAGIGRPDATADAPPSQRDVFQEVRAALDRGELRLPTMPQLPARLRRLVHEEDCHQAVVALLSQDPTVVSQLISISNTPYYRGFHNTRNIDEAIRRLGMRTTCQVVDTVCHEALLTAAPRKYRTYVKYLWKHCLACAHATEGLGSQLPIREDLFTLGLLHDIGKLALVQNIAALESKGRLNGGLEHGALSGILNAHHCEFGAELLQKWGFGTDFIQVARGHHDPFQSDPPCPAAMLVRVADLVAKAAGYGADSEDVETAEGCRAARELGLADAKIVQVGTQVADMMRQTEIGGERR